MKIIAKKGPNEGSEHSIDSENLPLFIGSNPETCQLLVEGESISDPHATIEFTDEGLQIINLVGDDQVMVNGNVIGSDPVLLKDKDSIDIAAASFSIEEETVEEDKPINESEAMEEKKPQEESSEELGAQQEAAEEQEIAEEDAEKEEITEEQEPSEEEPVEERGVEQSELFGVDELKENEQQLADVNLDYLEKEGRWLLKVVSGPNAGAEFVMQSGLEYFIGTDSTYCQVLFQDMSVSRKHASITISSDGKLKINDLESRNGVRVDGLKIEEPTDLYANSLVTLGTTTFLMIDREGEQQTLVSPPFAVGMQQEEKATDDTEEEEAEALEEETIEEEELAEHAEEERPEEQVVTSIGALMLLAIITGLFVVIGVGTAMLFRPQTVVSETVDIQQAVKEVLKDFPSVKFSYNPSTKRLLLIGHVLSVTDRNQIRYNLQPLTQIRNVDDNIVIDELVIRETNQLMNKQNLWRGVAVRANSPGRFELTGYLATREEASKLYEHINRHFPYLELLERNVVVEEEVINQASTMIEKSGVRGIRLVLDNGAIVISGALTGTDRQILKDMEPDLKMIRGVREVRLLISDAMPSESMIDLSDRYVVSGVASQAGQNINVVINGRILTVGDNLDGLIIKRIEGSTIFLERDGFMYKIEFKQ